MHAVSFRFAHSLSGKAEPDHKKDKGCYGEYGNRVPVDPVIQLFASGKLFKFFHRESHYIALSSFIEVTDCFVMDGMIEVPAVVGGEYQAAQNSSDNLIGSFAPKEGAVTAVVEYNEDPHQKTCCEKCQAQGEEIAHLEAEVHSNPEQEIGPQGINYLPDAAGGIGLIVFADYFDPGALTFVFLSHNKRTI